MTQRGEILHELANALAWDREATVSTIIDNANKVLAEAGEGPVTMSELSTFGHKASLWLSSEIDQRRQVLEQMSQRQRDLSMNLGLRYGAADTERRVIALHSAADAARQREEADRAANAGVLQGLIEFSRVRRDRLASLRHQLSDGSDDPGAA